MLEIERAVCGCDYGGTSWTTRGQADKIIDMLKLKPGRRLLDVGSGSGWPGLYLARWTGCDVTLTDLPLAGLRIARNRAAADQLKGEYRILSAGGAALPFDDGWFDAIHHADVLCCLVEKLAVLKSCRRVVRRGGKMVFSVIVMAPNLTAAGHKQAMEGGPAFIESSATYPEMLREANWEIAGHADLTAEFLESSRQHVTGQETYAREIADAFGKDMACEMVTRRRAAIAALENGLLRRELFEAAPAGNGKG